MLAALFGENGIYSLLIALAHDVLTDTSIAYGDPWPGL